VGQGKTDHSQEGRHKKFWRSSNRFATTQARVVIGDKFALFVTERAVFRVGPKGSN